MVAAAARERRAPIDFRIVHAADADALQRVRIDDGTRRARRLVRLPLGGDTFRSRARVWDHVPLLRCSRGRLGALAGYPSRLGGCEAVSDLRCIRFEMLVLAPPFLP